MPETTPLLMTPADAADYAGIARSRLYPLLMAGQIQSVVLGRRRYVPRTAIERFVREEIARQTGEASASPGREA